MPVDKSTARGIEIQVARRRRRRDLLELSVGYGLILVALWTPRQWQKFPSLAALIWIVLVTFLSFEGWSTMGLRVSRFPRSIWVVVVAMGLASLAGLLAWKLHTLHLPGGPTMILRRYWAYTIWAFLQEFILLDFVLLRLFRVLPNRKLAGLLTAALFATAHLPNPILTPVTLIWGFAACLLFLEYRNVYTLAMAHAIFGISIALTIPGPVDHNMRVGLGYLTYHRPHGDHHRSQKPQIVSTVEWVIAEAPIRRS